MKELNNNIFNNNIAGDTSNILIPDNSAIKKGIVFKSNIDSNVLNGFYNILSKAIQYLQFTGGLYSKEADYNEGNIASLVIKDSENYSIWQFRRNSNNPQVLNNNPPITGASITTINGIDIYEGGTLNTDWDKLTEDYDVEATPNTVMIRDEEGASNVNMPSNIENTTVVNNKYLEEQLQSGLSIKQDKLIAGTNVEITEDNVINVKGDVATDAKSVSYDNSNTNLEYITDYDFPKFKLEIPDTININLNTFQGTITKQTNNEYILSCQLNSYSVDENIIIPINNIEDDSNIFKMYSILAQFFDFNSYTNISQEKTIVYDLAPDECSISNISGDLICCFMLTGEDKLILTIGKKDNTPIPSGIYNISLRIKNKVLKKNDQYLFLISSSKTSLCTLKLEQDNNKIKLTGNMSSFIDTQSQVDGGNFYSEVIENYFNLIGTIMPEDLISTEGITSSNGKPVKFGVAKITGSLGIVYILAVGYEDESTISKDDIFTFNLLPDKNYTLEAIYKNVTNVQELGEALNEKDINLQNQIDILIKRYMIPPQFIQVSEANGTFDDNKSPANWYKKIWGITTVWKVVYNGDGITLRTEGGLSNDRRNNGIQEDAGRNATGSLGLRNNTGITDNVTSGIIYQGSQFANGIPQDYNLTRGSKIEIDLSRAYTTANEFRMRNRLMRIYILQSIEGVQV
ncbi:hypothetical protein NEI02_06420 [Brachyspira pilosicoli]|uniref:Hvp 101 VSH-1 tail protein n=1 Tax=Brachyspira pilosicoli TaxID=52584 RepID=A0AAJ6GGG9_BRAPL|nr:hypothetical protein [Brachyspira pilosicoli]WIH89338.1 hypothetical protein NEI02_06420 [Brachyspira pilosicoli]WIH91633.1 hypothetical protein NEI01_06420 [Brachyspira pilosicoli]WIH94555.1 hypothetical protein NEH99_09680 [Brachyspira pilosicoli]